MFAGHKMGSNAVPVRPDPNLRAQISGSLVYFIISCMAD